MNTSLRFFALVLAASSLVSGCATTTQPSTIVILPRTSFTVPVDIVGATKDTVADIRDYDVDKYWRPDDPVRHAADKFEVQVSGGKATPPQLSKSDPIWQTWLGRKVTYLVILADLRGDEFKGEGRLDTRRCEINLSDRYVSNSIVVEIQDTAVKVITPLKH